MKFLITGANGFIGSNLARRICAKVPNADITLLDLNISKKSLLEGDFTLIEKNLSNLSSADLPEVDVVFHAAALLGVDFVNSNPSAVVIENISSFLPLQKYLHDSDVRFVFFSTSEVYGDGHDKSSGLQMANSTSQCLKLPDLSRNRSSYALSKIVGEYISSRSSNYINLRPHNIYGTNMGNRHVIPNLIEKIWKLSNAKDLELFNPSHVRSFCYIDDAIDQILYLIDNEMVGTFNIGNPKEPIEMVNLANILLKKMDKKCTVVTSSETKGSPSFRRPEIDFIQKDYVNLNDGLDKMIKSFMISQSWNT